MGESDNQFIFDNSDDDHRLSTWLIDTCGSAERLDVATGHLEIGGLLALNGAWRHLQGVRILMGDNVSLRTKAAFDRALAHLTHALDQSLEAEKDANLFLAGVDRIVEALQARRIQCRVYRQTKFHAKAYITHATTTGGEIIAAVGSSNCTLPGLSQNVELNVRLCGEQAKAVADWFDRYWNDSEDVTQQILQVVERHVRLYTPFEVYARSLQVLFADVEQLASDWEKYDSVVYKTLDKYQKDGYHQLVQISERFGGALLCDGVGLGKTYVGLMLIERLTVQERKNVCLLVSKAARQPVWDVAIRKILPRAARGRLRVFNHTDLIRQASADVDFPQLIADLEYDVDAFVIDEAHHFRNPGLAGRGEGKPSRYRRLFDVCGNKQMFLLTATPVNNRLIDLQHMIELFSRKDPEYFQKRDPTLGIHSLPGHFRKMENDLDRLVHTKRGDDAAGAAADEGGTTNLVEAEQVLSDDRLFRRIVVQRSRAFVRESQEREGGAKAIFPNRLPPRVGDYEMGEQSGRLLDLLEKAFRPKKALFYLAIYSPLSYPPPGSNAIDLPPGGDEVFPGATRGRQEQIVSLIRTSFLKRFESSAEAFRQSCRLLLLKLLAFAEVHSETPSEQQWLVKYKERHVEIVGRIEHEDSLFDDPDAVAAEDLIPPEMIEEAVVQKLDRKTYNVAKMLEETHSDLETVADFLKELRHFKPKHDLKLQKLVALLSKDADLAGRKVLVFTEFTATARYLADQLRAAGVGGVDEIDGSSGGDRGVVIRRFAPYYNDSSSADLAAGDLAETRVLISTDVLSEGLNLQDATRLINYDLHWNPVRLMQRIGRVDRRMNPQIEQRLLGDHPEQVGERGTVIYWNFLPPKELNRLLSLYATVTHKTLRISKTFGIEGKKLLTPEDDYEALKDFNKEYDGSETAAEKLQNEFNDLLREHPDLEQKLAALPSRVFSGRAHPSPGARAVFFCYRLPGPPPLYERRAAAQAEMTPLFNESGTLPQRLRWREETGQSRWYLYSLAEGSIAEFAPDIANVTRSFPDTPRKTELPFETLGEVRQKVEKHIRASYLKPAGAPAITQLYLKAWMELN